MIVNEKSDTTICRSRGVQRIGLFVSLVWLIFNACSSPAVKTTSTSTEQQTDSQQNATAIVKSIKDGDAVAVKRLIADGISPNLKDEDGDPLLMVAITYQRKDIVEILLKAGVDVNAMPDDGKSVLIRAIKFNQTEIVELLIKSGIEVNVKDDEDATALQHAVDSKNADIVNLLLTMNPDLNAKGKRGYFPLFSAAFDYDIAKALLDKGADVNNKTSDGETALFTAVALRSAKTVRLFLEHGADINVKAENGWTPLKEAWLQGCLDLVQLLEKAGAKE
jgi:ankyrin repeat protein